MAEVGIERLGAGDRQKHRAQRHKTDHAVVKHEGDGQHGIEGQQYFGMLHDRTNRPDRDDGEPDAHDGAEKSCDAGGAARLRGKQHQQNDHGQRHHIGIERRGDELDAFDRR